MHSVVIKLMIMVLAALTVTTALLALEVRTRTGNKVSYTLKGVVDVVLLGVLISLLIVR
ncbi:hypothetical protein [Lacticaseibacillus jixiensis]|uniref:hypothetical protein n=1 Tax=Lacticaseibacillus jixiensis TaxID=3231926 RepID=UPI0036F239E8